jgi:GWxTD domain-containing protein
MKLINRLVWMTAASAILSVSGLSAQNPPPNNSGQSDKDKQAQSKNGKNPQGQNDHLTKDQQRKLKKELDSVYKEWLDSEVPYIITDAEREAFLRLSTNEEREQFIENFWLTRDPTPDTPENEFKEEHYRRIAYANEHFASGMPGWRTDRGRIYIIWGKADTIDTHPMGGSYNRTPEEGGGSTSTFPFEVWHYNYLEGIGNNIDLEFVDPSGSNEFHLTTDPGEKDALLHVPGAGLSEMEMFGEASKNQRFSRSDGTTSPVSMFDVPGKNNEFDRYALAAKVMVAPPPVKNKDLLEVVTSRIVRNQLPFDYHFDFLRITTGSVMVPITVEIANRQLTFQTKEGVHSAQLNLFARITTLGGRVVQIFEDTISKDFPDSLFQKYLTRQSIYQKIVPLRPGLYKLDIVVKDVQSGNVGVVTTNLQVPRFDEEKLDTSTLILAYDIQNVAPRDVGLGQFVLGDKKVTPELSREFFSDSKMGIYLQIYNIKVDEKTHKSDVTVQFRVTRGDQMLFNTTETSEEFKQTGDELTVQNLLPLSTFGTGKCKLEIIINDKIANQTLTRTGEFNIKPPAQTRAAAN